VITATGSPSISGRIRTLTLAMTLAAGMVFPSLQVAWADGPTPAPSAESAAGLSISVDTVEQLTGLTAIVASGGETVPVRAEPADESDSVAVVADGTSIALRVDVVDTVYDSFGVRWWPVVSNGVDGWVAGTLLTQATTADGDIVSSQLVAFEYTDQATAQSTARVFGNGQNVNVRAEPESTGEVVAKAADGEVVSLRIDMVDTVSDEAGSRWWPVTVDGLEGWISGFYLMSSDGAPTSSPETDPATSTPDTTAPDVTAAPPDEVTPSDVNSTPTEETTTGFAAGDFLQVFTGDGEGINVRSSGSPSAGITGQFADGEVVQVVSGPVSFESSAAGWYEVTNDNATGFVDGDLLITSVETIATSIPTPTEPPLSEEEEATVAATRTPTEPATSEPTAVATEGATAEPTAAVTEEASTGFIYPLASYTKTQAFGCSNLGFYSYNEAYGCPLHDGLDLAAPSGTPLLAAASGTVVTAGWCNCGLGYYVEIDHGDGIHTLYGHMASQPYVRAGQSVSQSEVIGPLGSTGISTGPHVHFMVKVNGVSQNPEDFLP